MEDSQPVQASADTAPFSKNSSSKIVYKILAIFGLIVLLVIAAIAAEVIPTNFIRKEKEPATSSLPASTPTPTVIKRFLSTPGANDKILNSLPKKVEPGVIYFYKNTNSVNKEKIDSYLEGKIAEINKQQKNLSVNKTNGKDKILITTKDYTVVTSIILNPNSDSKTIVKTISFDDLKVGDNIIVFSLQQANAGYVAGTIINMVKKE